MQAKLSYLVDRSTPFTNEKVELLDQLTNSIKNNLSDVKMYFKIE
jgi:hypothetical protein